MIPNCICDTRRTVPSLAVVLLFVWSLCAPPRVSSSAVAPSNDAECEKMFSQGVDVYERGLQVCLRCCHRSLYFALSASHLPIASCTFLSQMTRSISIPL